MARNPRSRAVYSLPKTTSTLCPQVVREVYLRDDIVPEAFEGADQVLVLDTNIVLHQIDLIASDACASEPTGL